jgi:hypothetical protein
LFGTIFGVFLNTWGDEKLSIYKGVGIDENPYLGSEVY